MACTRSSASKLWLLAWCLCVMPKSGSGYIFNSFACSCDSLPPLGLPFPAFMWRLSTLSVVSCFGMLGGCLLEACFFFSEEDWIWEEGRWGGGGGSRGRETVARMDCMKEEPILSKELFYLDVEISIIFLFTLILIKLSVFQESQF